MEESVVSGGWVRFENTTPDNLKVAPLSDRAHRLWFNAVCYCSRARSNGRVPAAIITTLSYSGSGKCVEELMAAGLLERPDEQTYLVHDYLDYNPSRERLDDMRDATRERVAKHREKRDGNSVTQDSVTALQPRDSRMRDRTGLNPEVVRLCERLGDRIKANDPKSTPDAASARWLTDMRLLVEDRGGDISEVERIIDWCQADPFWRANILSPGKLRKQFQQLVLRAKTPLRVVGGGMQRQSSARTVDDMTVGERESVERALARLGQEDGHAARQR